GYTKGTGTFHIPKEVLMYLRNKEHISGMPNFFLGSSYNLELVRKYFKDFTDHTIQKRVYLGFLVKNYQDVLKGAEPEYIDMPLGKRLKFKKTPLIPNYLEVINNALKGELDERYLSL
ncbi:MAG: hypothetical protein ACP5J9_09030, partial [Dictyoglomus sp.]